MQPLNPPTGLNASITGIDQQAPEFLTGEDFQKAASIAPRIPASDIPDLHTEDATPGAARRMDINKTIDTLVSKTATVDETVQRDLDAVRGKYAASPMDPKNILKNMIKKGEYKQDFKLFDHVWTLRALDQQDTLLALDEVRDSLETVMGRTVALTFAYIVYSLEALDGVPIYEWFPEIKLSDFNNNKMEYILAVKRALKRYMEALPPTIINSLYEKYLEVDDSRNKGLEELKNS